MVSKTPTLHELDDAIALAKSGREAPLVGGPIGLMWGVLLFAAFLAQYLILERILALPAISLAVIWIAFAIIGGLGVMVLGRKADARPGAHTVNNRVESHVWIMFSTALLSLVVGVIANQVMTDGSPQLWDMIVVFGFAGQSLAYGVVARMTSLGWTIYASLAAAVATIITMTLYGSTTLYLAAAIMIVFSVVIPSLISIQCAKA